MRKKLKEIIALFRGAASKTTMGWVEKKQICVWAVHNIQTEACAQHVVVRPTVLQKRGRTFACTKSVSPDLSSPAAASKIHQDAD